MRFKNGLHLIQIMEKKILKKYAKLMNLAHQATGRKEAIRLIHTAAKLKTKFDNYEMM
jgi:hypothetical protein